jgi:hypothetical protein
LPVLYLPVQDENGPLEVIDFVHLLKTTKEILARTEGGYPETARRSGPLESLMEPCHSSPG